MEVNFLAESMISVNKTAKLLGISVQTLHTISEDTLPVYRTQGQHRRYKLTDVQNLINERNKGTRTIIYSRVNNSSQKNDMDKQKLRNMEYCVANGLSIVQTFEEYSSGFDGGRKKLLQIVELAHERQFDILLLENKDRLTRFTYDVFEKFFAALGVKVLCVDADGSSLYVNEAAEDVKNILKMYENYT
jgi:predicted site-specific integrase-resolvase